MVDMNYSTLSKKELDNLKEFVKKYEESSNKERKNFIQDLAKQIKSNER